ncbi:MAG: SRPBCC domain-containing protein [Acidimicrobiales bacterium]
MSGSRLLVSLRAPAPPERTFALFTEEIGLWWRPNPLFQFTEGRTGRLVFEPDWTTPGPGRPGRPSRLVEIYDDGATFVIGQVREWAPPHRLTFSWRQASFAAGQETEVRVRFEAVGAETRVTVEHWGWDAIPQDHAARHGFPLHIFQLRHAEWWRALLGSLTAWASSP